MAKRKSKSVFEVVVGNVGIVYSGANELLAIATYNNYVEMAKAPYGRAASQEVNLIKDGQPIKTHAATNQVW